MASRIIAKQTKDNNWTPIWPQNIMQDVLVISIEAQSIEEIITKVKSLYLTNRHD